MSTNHTIADPTRLEEASSHGTRLIVYIDGIEGSTGVSSQMITLPEAVEVTFGRSRSCTVTVDSERISRTHFKVVRVGDAITVEDLESRNGTRVNGETLSAPRGLVPGDEISARPLSVVVTTSGSVRWRRRCLDAAAFGERLVAEADRGSRYKRTFALAMLRFEGEAQEVDAAIEALSSAVRRMDSIGDYGGNDVGLLFPELTAERSGAAVDRVLDVVRRDRLIVRAGIANFPLNGSQPGALIESARAALRLSRKTGKREAMPSTPPLASNIVAEASATKGMFAVIDKVAGSQMTVLILGETGAGKEVAAHAIHARSKRRDGAFVVLNCACLPSTLLESELFGHERGSFTGADSQKTGFFEAANGGTLFLDEIGEIEAGLQAKLLRVLETHKVTRVGGTTEIAVDVRVVCATNRDLREEVAAGRFRADLYYRIGGFSVSVPPLRERRADVLALATRFIQEVAEELETPTPSLSADAKDTLLAYAWPGNVRELRNTLERATVLASGGVIESSDFPDTVSAAKRASSGGLSPTPTTRLEAVERDAIARALEETGGNQTHAARNLGLTRRALIYRMEKHGLKPKPK